MNCPKCGAEVTPGDTFCGNCGASISEASNDSASDDTTAPTPGSSGLQEVSPPTQERRKKINWTGLLSAVVSVVVVIFLIYSCAMDGKTDYVGSVKQYYEPFEEAGYNYTCGQVFGRYMPNASWKSSESNGVGRVTVSGPLLDAEKFEVRFDVEPVPGEDGKAYYTVVSGLVDDEVLTAYDTIDVMAMMWDAYASDMTKEDFEMYYGG